MPSKIIADFDYTPAELLALVKEAIATVTKYGTSYTIGGRVFNRSHLPELYALQQSLEKTIGVLNTGLAYNLARRSRKP